MSIVYHVYRLPIYLDKINPSILEYYVRNIDCKKLIITLVSNIKIQEL
jgi:hypothetical protein